MLARRGRQGRRPCRGQHSSLGGRTLAGPPQRAFLGCLKVMQFPSTLESTARPAPGPTFPQFHRTMRITRIRVAYTLTVPPGKTEDAREALKTYITRCPAAMSVRGCIEIIDSAEISELPA